MSNKNKVEFIGYYGGDIAIARAAWTSTNIDIKSKTDDEIGDLLDKKLWNNKSGKPHKTPFERGIVEFNITLDQASHIHTLKHRLANINGESARYKELKEDKFYLPEDWNGIKVTTPLFTSKYFTCQISTEDGWLDVLKDLTELVNQLYHSSLKDLTPVLGRKRAKESSRFFKTMNNQITLSVMMNMSCFYNFYTLRHDDAAQKEIQWIAEMMLQVIKDIPDNPFKHTLKAFGL